MTNMLVDYLTLACTGTGRATFYNSAEDQEQALEAAHAELSGLGIHVDKVFHDEGGIFHHAGTLGQVPGPHPDHASYGSFATFADPDGNGWVLQEITERAPGR